MESRTINHPLVREVAEAVARAYEAGADAPPHVNPPSVLVIQDDNSVAFQTPSGQKYRFRTSTNEFKLFFGPNLSNPDAVPTLTVKMSANQSEFSDATNFTGGITPLACDIELLANAVGPNGEIWAVVSKSFKQMASSLPDGVFVDERKMKHGRLEKLCRADALAGSMPSKSPSFTYKQPIKERHIKDETAEIIDKEVQLSVDSRLFVARHTAASDDQLAADVALHYPGSFLAEWQAEHPEYAPNKKLAFAAADGVPTTWWQALYGKYDNKTMIGSLEITPYRCSLSPRGRILLSIFLDSVRVVAIIGSGSGGQGSAVTMTPNEAQMDVLAGAYGATPADDSKRQRVA